MSLIKKPNELTVKTTLSALIYGQPGMGKTTFMGHRTKRILRIERKEYQTY